MELAQVNVLQRRFLRVTANMLLTRTHVSIAAHALTLVPQARSVRASKVCEEQTVVHILAGMSLRASFFFVCEGLDPLSRVRVHASEEVVHSEIGHKH